MVKDSEKDTGSNIDEKLGNDNNPAPTLSGAAAQATFTPERFKSGHRKASIFTMLVLAAGCVVLAFLYYRTVKSLHSTRSNLATVQQQNDNLQSQLKTVQVSGPASADSQAGVTVKIPELGLQYQDTGQFSDIIWTLLYDKGGNPVGLNISSKKVINAHTQYIYKNNITSQSEINNCGSDSANLGTINLITPADLANPQYFVPINNSNLNSLIQQGKVIKSGNNYLYYNVPQAACSSDSAVDQVQTEAMNSNEGQAFFKALQTSN